MAHGFYSGVFWGTTTSVVIAGFASIWAPAPRAPEIAARAPVVVSQPRPQASDVENGATAAQALPDEGKPEAAQPALRAQPDADPAPQRTPLEDANGGARPQTSDVAALEAPEAPIVQSPVAIAPDEDPSALPKPEVSAKPAPDPAPELPQESDVQSALPAQTSEVAVLEAPQAPVGAGSVAITPVDPILPNPQTLAPAEPNVATTPIIVTQSAVPTPAAPQIDSAAFVAPDQPDTAAAQTPQSAQTPEAPSQAGDAPQVAALTPAPAAPVAAPVPGLPAADQDAGAAPLEVRVQAPVQGSQEVQPDAVVLPDAETPAGGAPAVAAQPPAPQTPSQDAAQLAADDVPSPPAAPAGDASDTQQTAMLAPTVSTAIGTPAIQLTQRSGGVTIRRPNRGSDTATAEITPASQPQTDSAPQPDTPMARNAIAFENPDNKPLMSIVLIDDGTSVMEGRAGLAALGSFPYPLSFAVDSSLEDFEDRVAIYRKAKFEVMALVDLPAGATASDAETAFAVNLPRFKDVIGILEGVEGGLQGTRDAADQVTSILAQSGHGLVTQDKGLNTMPKLAVKEGVPAAPVFRDFDSKNQTARVIRRFLDQAAFRAGQEGAVIMLGRMRPDTITALLLWGLQDRATQVALAPVSAVLQRAQ